MVSKPDSTANDSLSGILDGGKPLAASSVSEEASGAGSVPAGESGARGEPRPELLRGIQLRVRVELGRRSFPLKDALRVGVGSVIDLEKGGDDPVNLYVDDLLIARGVVTVIDDRFCIRVTEVLPPA